MRTGLGIAIQDVKALSDTNGRGISSESRTLSFPVFASRGGIQSQDRSSDLEAQNTAK